MYGKYNAPCKEEEREIHFFSFLLLFFFNDRALHEFA